MHSGIDIARRPRRRRRRSKSGVTQLPAPIALAATWNTGVGRRRTAQYRGRSRGAKASTSSKGRTSISRVSRQGGRVWEMYGEDPYLTGKMAVADITAIQHQGIMAMAKHYVANDQEAGRIGLDTRVSDRALRELYLRPFQTAVQDGHVASTMCSYNAVNGPLACQHEELLSAVLKGEWGFPGFIRSDWGAVSDTGAAFNAGMDWMKSADPAGLAAAVQAGRVRKSRVDDAVERILREMFAYGIVDHPLTGTFGAVVTDAQHVATARSVAEDATVLLKNSGILPLNAATVGSIAVIGPDGGTGEHTAGGGSGHVNAPPGRDTTRWHHPAGGVGRAGAVRRGSPQRHRRCRQARGELVGRRGLRQRRRGRKQSIARTSPSRTTRMP